MPELSLTFKQSTEAMAKDIKQLREELPKPTLGWLQYVKLPFLVLAAILAVPPAGYIGALTANSWVTPAVWVGGFMLGWLIWDNVIMRWAKQVTLREYERYRPERTVELIVNDTGLSFSDDVSSTVLKWEGIQKVIAAANGVGIIADMMTYYIPGSAFATDADKYRFVTALQAEVRGGFQLRP